MKKRIIYLGSITTALLVWAACDRVFDLILPSTHDETGQTEYLSFTDHGCQSQSGLYKMNSAYDAYLAKHRLIGDTLTLTIHYWANCCPAFVDSVSIHDDTIDICIDDTLAVCDCICEYDNTFIFLFSETGTLRVRFGWIGTLFELDTLIHIP